MTIEEMHIDVDMDLQKVNTYTQRNLQPQEIDWFLNKEVLKFIKQRTNPRSNVKQQGTDSTVKRYEDLDDLTKYVDMDVQVNSDGTGTCVLPDDYYAYITSKTNVYQLCSTDNITTKSKTLYKCVFPLSFPTGVILSAYKLTLTDSSGDTELFNLTSLPSGYIQNVDINKQRFMLLKAINILVPESLDAKQANAYSFYWERYAEEFNNNDFILVSETPFTSVTVHVNGNDTVYNSTQVSYNYYDENSELEGKNRLIEDEFQFSGQKSFLSSSSAESPAIQLKQGILKIDFPKTIICQRVKLMYVSKPTILDLALQRNLNMKDTIVKEIVSNTVRFLKGVFNGDYQTYLNENVMIE